VSEPPRYPTITEPHEIEAVPPTRITSRAERQRLLAAAGNNLFNLRAGDVTIDLLTGGGTAAPTAEPRAGVPRGDEAHAGGGSSPGFEAAVRDLFGARHVIPVNQGRGAERILLGSVVAAGQVVPSNGHCATSRANIAFAGARAVDLVIEEGLQAASLHPFKGNMDLAKLEVLLAAHRRGGVPVVLLALTSDAGGGQPVSLENVRGVAALCRKAGVPLYLDASRFAEDAFLIAQRELGQGNRPVIDIARELLRLADGCIMSAGKDGLGNTGGFISTSDDALARRMRNLLVLAEGFPAGGGPAGRVLEAIACGLHEALDESHLAQRARSIAHLGEKLLAAGIPIVRPPGGHAIYLDAAALLPHIPPLRYPGQALACEIYLAGGIRSCEVGSVMLGRRDPGTGAEQPAAMELVRLALPRRGYTHDHGDHVVEVLSELGRRRAQLRGLRIVEQPELLRHLTARFAWA
jgi:tryptophanase